MNTNPGLIVMYHYVREDSSPIPEGIRPLFLSEFRAQLDWLSERYDIVSSDDFLTRLSTQQTRRPPCLLTFDDGTKDHAEVVTPILASRGLTGTFFVLSGPAERGTMPLTHAIHWLLGNDEKDVWDLFCRHGGESLGDPGEARRIYHYETPLRARIKYAANMVLPFKTTEKIVQAAVKSAGITMKKLAKEWFVSAGDIRAMHAAGMTIAIHGCAHRSLQVLGSVGIQKDIQHCASYLAKLTGKAPTWYACPFGGSGAREKLLQAMRRGMAHAGVIASVSTEKSCVHTECDRLSLPRLDTIDLPPRRVQPQGIAA